MTAFLYSRTALLATWNKGTSPVLVTVVVRPVKSSHTVCAFRLDEGKLRYFDNDILRADSYDSYEEIARVISQGSLKLVCWDVRGPADFELKEFHTI